MLKKEDLTCDEVAEWLRRWTANPLCSARVGSNPILVVWLSLWPSAVAQLVKKPPPAMRETWIPSTPDIYASLFTPIGQVNGNFKKILLEGNTPCCYLWRTQSHSVCGKNRRKRVNFENAGESDYRKQRKLHRDCDAMWVLKKNEN